MKKLIIIGGGASGMFLAANIKSDNWKVLVLEQASQPLQKVKVSGGGRCNVTNACFIPRDLVKNYPRGNKELMSVFSRFQPSDTFEWFSSRGVELSVEDDNRVFPESNSSQTIIDVLLCEAEKNGTVVHYNSAVKKIEKNGTVFKIETSKTTYECDAVVIASGSSPKMNEMLRNLGINIIRPVPSLFTFNCKDKLIQNLQGTNFSEAEIQIPELKTKEFGPVLITHWGLSGPAILRLSAWKARELAEMNYSFHLKINWISENIESVKEELFELKKSNPKKSVHSIKIYSLTSRFWTNVLETIEIKDKLMADLRKDEIQKIAETLTAYEVKIGGKSTFKDEFVTCGGVDLKEIDFKTMQSKSIFDLYFSGEILNIDAITGGFNFQACWSEAFIISQQFL